MEVYDTEQERVEELKKWWKENGRSVIFGTVLGLGAVFGWRGWQSYQSEQTVRASLMYEQLVDLVERGAREEASAHGELLVQSHPGSLYGSLAALTLAHLAVTAGDLAAARQHLDWVARNAADPALKPIARLRLARVLLGLGQHDEALAAVTGEVPESFRGAFAELRGDVLAVRGERANAQKAYREALDALPASAATRALVQLKLDDLGQALEGPARPGGGKAS